VVLISLSHSLVVHLSSITPKVYADNGTAQSVATSSSADTSKRINGTKIQLCSYILMLEVLLLITELSEPETGNFGQLIQNILSPHTGSWGTTDYGVSEFYPNFLSKSPRSKYLAENRLGGNGINKLSQDSVLGLSTDNTDLRGQLNQQDNGANNLNSYINNQKSSYNNSLSSRRNGGALKFLVLSEMILWYVVLMNRRMP